jgi:hypothetical protein
MKVLTNPGLLIGCLLVAWPWDAGAVSQFTRKYNEPCSTCHNVFPRLNYYGERFLRNGYQKPDSEEGDGDKTGKKKVGDELVIGKLEDWVGVRLNVTPFKAVTNTNTVNGAKTTQYTVGNPDWMQLFVAGTIFKDVSIFIENEFASGSFKFNWYYLTFANLAGDLANIQVGNISPLLFASFPNRLPLHPALKNTAYQVRGSFLAPGGGKATTSAGAIDTSSARPGAQYYGERGPVIWWAGLSPGSAGTDKDQFLNYWVGTRFEIIEDWESALEGSSVSLHYQTGTDTNADANPQARNDYFRVSPSLNLRVGGFDLQAGYVYGEDENVKLAATGAELAARFDGFTAVAAYVGDSKWIPALQWDVTNLANAAPVGAFAKPATPANPASGSPGAAGAGITEVNKLTPTLTYLMRENLRITAYAGFDLLKDQPGHTEEQHEFIINIRTMF